MSTPVASAARSRRVHALVAALLAVAALAACGGGPDGGTPDHERASTADRPALPPVHAGFDYQIGGGYTPPDGVRVVSRDRSDKPAAGRYSICYVNGFQAQPSALDWWQENHPDLVLHDADGEPVMDTDWNEALLDTRTAARRKALARIVGRWIEGCAEKGFQAVELDNLDSYERSGKRLTRGDNVKFAALLTRRAHRSGLAAGQKNGQELLERRSAMGFDFAVTEECGQYKECGQYAKAYDGRVLDVEYTAKGLAAACRNWGERLSIVRRDLDVRPEGEDGYLYKRC
ncbi:endo alpha-1,4 polygalactosaminidase [Streptomyces spirodelae]|uniref:Endo alpha-1,4 polygalactosaminidase n=1 Tax=Streptomyces spirodelae TaxID=2812904 RepID=A0ABS3WZH2_9ACTN|nr:endo alpha-1,4 polygalactosaminidase [Streptomyces spirodelae]MBO8188546.1 endo alpha-1,4 polygalactosaminidase [Streptomyces spirodelae]